MIKYLNTPLESGKHLVFKNEDEARSSKLLKLINFKLTKLKRAGAVVNGFLDVYQFYRSGNHYRGEISCVMYEINGRLSIEYQDEKIDTILKELNDLLIWHQMTPPQP